MGENGKLEEVFDMAEVLLSNDQVSYIFNEAEQITDIVYSDDIYISGGYFVVLKVLGAEYDFLYGIAPSEHLDNIIDILIDLTPFETHYFQRADVF